MISNTVIEPGSIEAIKDIGEAGLGVNILAPWVTHPRLRKARLSPATGPAEIGPSLGAFCIGMQEAGSPEEAFTGLCETTTQYYKTQIGFKRPNAMPLTA